MMKMTTFIFCVFALPLQSCFDVFKEDEIEISQTLSLVNQNSKEYKGYLLTERKSDGAGLTLVDCFVTDLWQNDNLILLKAIERDNCQEKFFQITKTGHQDKYQVVEIRENELSEKSNSINFTRKLSNLTFECP